MKCYLCGYDRLTRNNIWYARHNGEAVPLCEDCVTRINAAPGDAYTLLPKQTFHTVKVGNAKIRQLRYKTMREVK